MAPPLLPALCPGIRALVSVTASILEQGRIIGDTPYRRIIEYTLLPSAVYMSRLGD